MKNTFTFLALTILASCASQQPAAKSDFSNVKLGTWTQTNEMKGEGVILIPQWHLGPSINVQSGNVQSGTKLPQETNQRAIYTQLSSWIGAHTVDALLAEGCEGDIAGLANKKFNGWSIEDLKNELAHQRTIDSILAPIAFKVDARYSKEITVTCGDDDKLIKENQLALSNLRGLAGFKLRIEQGTLSANDRQSYVNSAAEILKLPRNAKRDVVIAKLNSEIKKSITEFEMAIHLRDEGFISKANSIRGIKVIVIGAAHLPDLKAQLAQKNIPFSIWTPVGLDDQDGQLIEQLKAKLNSNEGQS